MSGATDSGMVKIMGIVMACLGVFAVICVLAARILSSGSDDFDDAMMRNALVQRIQPVGAVRTSADDLPVAETVTAMAGDAAKTGEELVGGICAGCHISGAGGAPKLDDQEAWAERREAGLDALVASVINGKGSMPARGGSAYSDDEIRLAVQHIAMFEDTEAAAPAAESDDTAAAETEAPPVAEETETAQAATDDAPVVAVETEAEEAAAETKVVAVDQANAEENTAQAVEEIAAESTGADAIAALVVGEVPDGLTDNIKANVDGVCAGCHLAGVAGAPKTGDKAAWQERADKGLAALTASVINGLNVMPPRGGSALTDEEIPIAIQYLMSK